MKDTDMAILGIALVGMWYLFYIFIEKTLFSFVKQFSMVPRATIFIAGVIFAPFVAVALVVNFYFYTRRQRARGH
jgi:hypothetical protein